MEGKYNEVDMEGKYNLAQKQFESNAGSLLRKLWKDKDFADVTLATADDKQIKAHKMILSSSSTFFENILLKNPHQNPLLYLKDISFSRLELILQFIYCGQCEVQQEDLVDFLATGRDLKVNGLADEEDLTKTNYVGGEKNRACFDTGTNLRQQSGLVPSDEDIYPDHMLEIGTGIAKVEASVSYNENSIVDMGAGKVEVEASNNYSECSVTLPSDTWSRKRKHDVVSPNENGKFPCDLCDYEATRPDNLRIHKQSRHEGVRFSCEECGKEFSNPSGLSLHKRTKHEGRTYDCETCGMQYAGRGALKRHIRTHEKDYVNNPNQQDTSYVNQDASFC